MKKRQFALIFMTLVIMLAVWYVKSPLNASKNKENDSGKTEEPVSAQVSEFAKLREAVREQRAVETASWDAIIADENATLANKQEAVLQKASISDLTEREVLLEIQVINLGYADAFIHYTVDGVEVHVLAEEESGSQAVEIINMVYSEFDDAPNVVVNFKIATETK